MRNAKAAELDRAATEPMFGDIREARKGRAPADARETEERRRLTLRQLNDWIEALREEHARLEMRVDKLAEMVNRMAATGLGGPGDAGFGGRSGGQRYIAVTPLEGVPRVDAESRFDGMPQVDALPRFDGMPRVDAAQRIDAPPERASKADEGTGGTGRDAFGRSVASGESEAVRGGWDVPEDRTSFGFAIWAGVERAIGNAAAMLAAGRDDGSRGAERPARSPARTEAPIRDRRAPEHGRQEVPVESLLVELREAARIADEIAANASADEPWEAPAHPARSTDTAGGPASGGVASAEGSNGSDGAAIADRANQTGASCPEAERAADQDAHAAAAQSAGPSSAAHADAQSPAAHAAAPPAAAHAAQIAAAPTASARTAVASAPTRTWRPSPDPPLILIPRSERHRTRKKRSLWERLFRRQPAGS